MRQRLVRQLAELSIREWWWLLELAATTLLVECGVRRVSLQRIVQLTCSRSESAQARATTIPSDLLRTVRRFFRHYPFHLTCLKQSLVLLILLRRRGLRPALKIGVDTTAASFTAHAWVEQQGRVLLDAATMGAQFPAIFSLGHGS